MNNLAWPAVAGNVTWSFASLAIVHGINHDTAPRLAVLFVLAFYLAAEWYRSSNILPKNGTASTTSLFLDFIFVICIIWFAIGTYENMGSPAVALLIILTGIGVGHLFGLWKPAGVGKGNKAHGWVSLAASATLGATWFVTGLWNTWIAFIAISIVLIVWAMYRRGQT